nr:hypothetical protein [Tanacetum cinerariifolium]
MDDPNITMEEYIRLEEEKARRQGRTFDWQTSRYGKMEYYENKDDSFMNLKTEYPAIVFNDISDATFSRELTLRYHVDGYDEGIVHSYEQRLETIWGRSVNRVHMLDFAGLTDGMRQTLEDRLSMVYAGDDEEALFTSQAWRQLFKVREPLVREFILEFLSTCRMSDTKMGLDVVDTLCFQLGGARKRMTWRDFLGTAPSYVHIGDPTINHRTANVPYLLAQYLFHDAEGRKSEARLFRDHFIGRQVAHFVLVGNQGLSGLSVVPWVASGPERQQAAATGAPRAVEDALLADEGAQAVPTPIQAPQPRPPVPQPQTIMAQLMDASGRTNQAFDSTFIGNSQLSFERHVRPRIGDASTSTAPQTDDQPDP